MFKIHILSVFLFSSGTISLILGIYALLRPRTPLLRVFALLNGLVVIYTFGYGLELMAQSIEEMLFWSKIQYLGIPFLTPLLLLLAIYYTGQESFLNRFWVGLILIVPVMTLVARFSNSHHHLFYRSAEMIPSALGAMMKIEAGPFYIFQVINSNLAWFISFFLLFRFLVRCDVLYRRQVMVMVVSSGIQWFGYIIYLSGLGPDYLDLNPLLFVFSMVLYALGIFKFSLFSLVPVARAKVFEEMRDGVIVLDAECRLVDYNRCSALLFPKIRQGGIGKVVQALFPAHPVILQALEGNQTDSMELSLVGPEGNSRFFMLSVDTLSDGKNRDVGRIITFTDITAQKVLIEELGQQATRDELTGIYNRRHLMKLAGIEMERYKRSQSPLAVLILDLDHFKRINDSFGHQCGDIVLKAFAGAIGKCVRNLDIFGRYGGEEFVILMPDTGKRMSLKTAQRLCEVIRTLEIPCMEEAMPLTVSIGVSGTWIQETPDLTTLFLEADKALYEAKERGRDMAVVARY